MKYFSLGMTEVWSTTKTHINNTKDDKRWETTKGWGCRQGTTKWQQAIGKVLKRHARNT